MNYDLIDKISVIIPVYNVSQYIKECLESVVNQTYDNLEIIVVDDGSDDGSGGLCDLYAKKDPRVTVLHQSNQGLSAARNTGLEIMTGQAVVFLDSDDAISYNMVELMRDCMLDNHTDIVICHYTDQYSTGCLSKNKNNCLAGPLANSGLYNRIDALRALADGNINHSVWNKMYRYELWKKIRFPDGHVYEDSSTTYRVFDKIKTAFVIEQYLYFHRKRPGNITDTFTIENANDWILSHKSFESYVERNIPGVFTKAHLLRVRQETINGLISQYVRASKKRIPIGNNDLRSLRNLIINMAKEPDHKPLNLSTKVAYYMIEYCPWILTAVYPVLYPLYRTMLRIKKTVFIGV